MTDLSKIYAARFEATGLSKRDRVWKILCSSYFQRIIPENSVVLDLGCGYGEFINNIKAGEKHGLDVNADSLSYLNRDVSFINVIATNMGCIEDGKFDCVFTSNFLEHLRSKKQCDLVLMHVFRVLKPGGRFIIMGPNIKYAFADYWDYYDHYLPLSHLSISEALAVAGFDLERVVPRFLPYTMNNRTPAHPILVKAYLAFPPAWRLLGKQFLVTARKPA